MKAIKCRKLSRNPERRPATILENVRREKELIVSNLTRRADEEEQKKPRHAYKPERKSRKMLQDGKKKH